MTRAMLSTFAAAALVSLAAGGGATAKTDASLLPADEPRSGAMARIADVLEPAPAVPPVRLAPNYMKVDGVDGAVTNKKAGKDLTAPQSGKRKGSRAERRRR